MLTIFNILYLFIINLLYNLFTYYIIINYNLSKYSSFTLINKNINNKYLFIRNYGRVSYNFNFNSSSNNNINSNIKAGSYSNTIFYLPPFISDDFINVLNDIYQDIIKKNHDFIFEFIFYLKTNDKNYLEYLKSGPNINLNIQYDDPEYKLLSSIYSLTLNTNINYKYEGFYNFDSLYKKKTDKYIEIYNGLNTQHIYLKYMSEYNKQQNNHFVDFRKHSAIRIREM